MKEYNHNQSDNLNESSIQSLSKKTSTKKAVKDTLAKIGIASTIAGGTVAPAATSFIPETVASINIMATTTGVAVKTITLGTAAALAAACDRPDITPPNVEVVNREISISGGEALRISGNQVYIGNNLVFRCSDDVSTNLNISVTFNGKPISSGFVFNEGGTINGKATDEAGNPSKPASATINKKEVIQKPEITVLKSQVDISKGGKTSVNGKEFFIGNEKVIVWTEDNCTPSIKFDGKDVTIGYTIEKEGTLVFTLTNSRGIPNSENINAIDGNKAPEVVVYKNEGNIFGGVNVKIEDNQLTLGNLVVAKGTDDHTKDLDIKFEVDGKIIKSGEELNVSSGSTHTGKITFTDEKNKSTEKNIQLENNIGKVVSGLDKLNNLSMEVDKEVNLLNGISYNGAELVKVEIEIDGNRYEISNPNHYTPKTTGSCKIILTLKGEFENTGEVTSNILTIKGPEYQGININNIKPVEILPIIGQVEVGDKECYSHIEHLRIAEATRIRDMMWKYGAGSHSPEQYQELMNRLNTGIRGEIPSGDVNYEMMGIQGYGKPDDHAYVEWSILNEIIKHTNFKLLLGDFEKSRQETMAEYIKSNPNTINIFGSSTYANTYDKTIYDNQIYQEDIINLCNLKQFIIFAAGTNIKRPGGIIKNKIYNGEYNSDEHGEYSLASLSNSDNNSYPNSHLLVTIGTNAEGDADLASSNDGGSKFPIGFAKNVLFAGRTFPFPSSPDKSNRFIQSEYLNYQTSYTNYTNVAIMDLCFQMFAEVKDVDELLEMVRSTCDTDYIRLDGQTQELQLMNPAKFFKKYLMPKDIPSSIQPGQTIPLNKGYYKGVIFNIPGAEVKVNGQWIEYNKTNEALIKSQNPMTLEWRLNGDGVARYSNDGSVTGKITVVDDQWNGLNLDKEGIKISAQRANTYSYIPGNYSNSIGGYGEGNYGQTLPGYGQGDYGKNPGNYGQTLPGYGQGDYGKNPGNYGQTLPGYGQGEYGKNPGSYGNYIV